MGLFSRRKKSDPAPPEGVEPGEQPIEPVSDAPTDAAAQAPTEPAGPEAAQQNTPASPGGGNAHAAASVGISMSAFRGLGVAGSPDGPPVAPPAPQPGTTTRRPVPAEAPPPSESAPGLRDNVLLRQALAALSPTPTAPELMNVARQFLQGHVFLRVQGDARELLAKGEPLPLSIAARGDAQYVLAYSGGTGLHDALRADGDRDTSAAGQPVLAVLRHVLGGTFAGIIVDNSSAPARAVLPRPILERALAEADAEFRIKTLLAGERTDATAAETVALLVDAPLWVAVRRTEAGALGVAESRTTEGQRFLEVFSHPLEALALGRGDQAAPLTAAQLATALTKDLAIDGVLVDPAGPWIRLTRADLAPVLALAP